MTPPFSSPVTLNRKFDLVVLPFPAISSPKKGKRDSLVLQWLRLCFHCRRDRFDPGWETKILHAVQCGQKNK